MEMLQLQSQRCLNNALECLNLPDFLTKAWIHSGGKHVTYLASNPASFFPFFLRPQEKAGFEASNLLCEAAIALRKISLTTIS